MNRAKLEAIRSEVVPVQPDVRAKLQPALGKTASPTLEFVALPKRLDLAVEAALKDRALIVRPLCPRGVRSVVVAGRETCIEGDAWSDQLFRSVVSMLKIA